MDVKARDPEKADDLPRRPPLSRRSKSLLATDLEGYM